MTTIEQQQNETERAKLKRLLESYLASNSLSPIAQQINYIGEKTKAEYDRKINLLREARQTPFAYCKKRNLSKKTYQTMRASFKRLAVNDILAALEPEATTSKMVKAISCAKKAITADRLYAPVADQTKERRLRESGKISKKRTLKGLPQNWRDQIFNYLSQLPPDHPHRAYAPLVQILNYSGCRPAELFKGVNIRKVAGAIEVVIIGSKCSTINDSGQVTRTLKYPATSAPGQALAALLSPGQQQNIFKLPKSPSAFQKAYKLAATNVLGKPGKRISPYSARHQFSADLKIAGMSQKDVACAMGHQAAHSQSQYSGARRKGTGYHGLKATAPTTVRHRPERPIPEKSEDTDKAPRNLEF